jgi:glycosyltransferase involved in cell wall biosynthesis
MSAVNQVVKPAQIVVVYNSSDPIPGSLRNYLQSFGVLILEIPKLIGPSKARNLGLLSSNQEYVAFLDADDEWVPNKLLLQLNFMKENSYSLCTTDFTLVDSANIKLWNMQNGNYTKRDIQRRCHIGFGSTVMIRREIIGQTLLFDESLLRFEDWDFMMRFLISSTKYGNLGLALTVVHRLPSNNWKQAKKALSVLKEKHRHTDTWDRHLASGIHLERAVIQFREKNPIFLLNIFVSLLMDARQLVFFRRNIKNRFLCMLRRKLKF